MNHRVVAENQEHLRLQAGGALNPRRHLYIERPDDQTLLNLLSEGQYVNVLTSRQMGKSSLMVRTAEALTKRGVKCAIVDLAAELGTPENATAYFLGLLSKIARDLKIKVDLPTWWAERPEETVNQRLMRFFREVVLEQVPGPVVCFLDEIDSTLNPKLAWTDDLFTALRGMHNERPMVPAYERLTFCLIGVAWPNELIKDRRTTPYNVGSTLELRDFDLARDNLTPLVHAIGANPEQGRRVIERVLYWTGGHPYLTARLCAGLREIGAQAPEDVDGRVNDGFRSLDRVSGEVHFQQVLRFLETRVASGLATIGLYEKILKGARERDQPAPAHTELKLSGLVKRNDEGCLVVRNRIYERLFDQRWVESTKPKRALARTRRYAIAASIAALIIAGAATAVITYLGSQLSERERLAALRITITPAQTGEGNRSGFPVNASQAMLKEAAPLLKGVGPVTELDLSGTQVADLTPVGTLVELKWLDLVGAPVSDLEPIGTLTKLQWIDIGGTKVTDLSILTQLRDLEYLAAGGGNTIIDEQFYFLLGERSTGSIIDDFNAVPRKNRGNGAPITHLRGLENLTKLRWLDLYDTKILDFTPISTLKQLWGLSLINTPLKDISLLGDLEVLRTLAVGNTQVADATPLTKLTKLQLLSLSDTQVADAAPLANLTNLQLLNLSNTQVADLAPLTNLTNLRWLRLEGTQVTDAAPLADLTNLQLLNLSNTQVADLAPLTGLTNLRELYLLDTKVTDAAPLADLAELQTLELSRTRVEDVTPLANLTNLQSLNLSGTQVADATPLVTLTKLRSLNLTRARVSQQQVTELKQALAERGNTSVEIRGP